MQILVAFLLAAVPAAAPQVDRPPVTLAAAVEAVTKVCRLYVEKDYRDVRAFEQRLGRNGYGFKEVTEMRVMCEVYAQGRDDAATRPNEGSQR